MTKLYIRFYNFKIKTIRGVILEDVKVESEYPDVTLIYPITTIEDNDALCEALNDMIEKSSVPSYPYMSSFAELFMLAMTGRTATTPNVSVWTDGSDSSTNKKQRVQ
jgi:hypothetical protein